MTDSEPLSEHDEHLKAFVWPPKAQPPVPSQEPARPPIHIRLPNRFLESIETHLLGRTAFAFDRWALQTGWTRDQQSEYCWRCGSSVGAYESDGEGCASCREKPLPWDRAIRLGQYTGVLRDEVLSLKFGCWRPTGTGLGSHLGLAILAQLKAAQVDPADATLVPIPMHRFRRVARGVDHTLVIARGASKSSGCRIGQLLKARYRPEQVGLSMTARAQNVRGAFNLSKQGQRQLKMTKSQSRQVLVLIDDVRTTGATFVAGAKILKHALKGTNAHIPGNSGPVEIWIASIGVTGESRRGIVDAHR